MKTETKREREERLYPRDRQLNYLYQRHRASDSLSERDLIQQSIDARTILVETMTPAELRERDRRVLNGM